MAFQFVPPFEEGDKQTNNETGVEYIFTDGAWRPLGPKFEAQFDELDERYLIKTGDSYTGYLDFTGNPSGARFFRDDKKLFSISDFDSNEILAEVEPYTTFMLTGVPTGDSTARQLIRWNSQSLYIYRLGDPVDDGNAVSLGYANKSYLKLKDANVVNNNFRIKSDTKVYISTAGDELSLYNVKEPTSSHHAATKSYVDSQIGIGIAPPAHLRWIWRQYDSTIDPGEGKFAYNSSSGFFRINYITADGVNLGKSRPSSKDVSFSSPLIGSIWYRDGDGWKLKQMFDVNRMQWDRNDCIWLYRKSIIVGADGFTADVQYHITIGGLF